MKVHPLRWEVSVSVSVRVEKEEEDDEDERVVLVWTTEEVLAVVEWLVEIVVWVELLLLLLLVLFSPRS